MSRLDFCINQLVDDCYDWKNDNCDECNIFKAYCEGARRAKNSIVRCKDCRWWNSETKGCKRNPSVEAWYETDFCKYGERQCNYFGERREP